LEPLEQDEARASFWPGRRPEDGLIDLNGSAAAAERLVRAVTRPYPGAFVVSEGRKLIVWKARLASTPDQCEGLRHLSFRDGVLCLVEWEDAGPAEADEEGIAAPA
jgi:methionyl-tRNA formyltransferase